MNPSFRTRLRLGVSVITMIAAWNAAIAQEPNAPPPVSPGNAPAAPSAPQEQPSTTPSDATRIPQITVTAPKETPSAPAKPATTAPRQQGGTPAPVRTAPAAPARTAPVQTAAPAQTAAQIAAAREAAATRAFTQQVERANQVRDNIMPKTGTDVTTVTHQDISNAPGGANQSVSDILVTQFPGV
jgi:outer membrane biosynthesis protein TonB